MTTKFKVDDERSQFHAVRAVQDLPLNKPWLIEIKRYTKKRTGGQNNYHWGGLIGDFVEQGFFDGRQFEAEDWHYYFKKKFLPEMAEDELTLDGYQKWREMPDGELKLVGSTTQLTTKGFSQFLEQCYALGSELGIRFTANV